MAETAHRLVGNGTDTHQVVTDVTTKGLNGSQAETILKPIGIITNKHYISKDTGKKNKWPTLWHRANICSRYHK